MPYYPRFITSAETWIRDHPELEITREQLEEADQRLFDINQAFYDDRLMFENNISSMTMDEIKFKHNILLQEFFEDYFGEDGWDDRHEIYVENE